MGGIGCGLDQESRGDSPQPAEHDDHKPQAEDPAPRRPSAAAPDLVCGWVPSAIAQQPRRSQPRPPPPGVGGHKLHHEPSDRDHNGPRGGIAPALLPAPDRSQVTVRSGRLQGGLDNNAPRNPPACLTDRSPARRVRRVAWGRWHRGQAPAQQASRIRSCPSPGDESQLGSQDLIRHLLAGTSAPRQQAWLAGRDALACRRRLIARAALVSRRLNASMLQVTAWTVSALPQDHQSS
jgi:hypothetical protein